MALPHRVCRFRPRLIELIEAGAVCKRWNSGCFAPGMVAVTLMKYEVPLTANDGKVYRAKACGRGLADGTWEGWFEFESVDGELVWRTSRETTQPNLADLEYWATGISSVFLEGAFQRAMEPNVEPAPPVDAVHEPLPTEEPVLDPFVSYARGEAFLRRRLAALDAWHLQTIARSHRMVAMPSTLDRLGKPELIELIVAHVRAVSAAPAL
jgi:hypothetical protein